MLRGVSFAIGLSTAAVLAQGRGGFQPPQAPQPTRAVPAPHFEYAGPSAPAE
jgi:hypothetical protein